MKHANYELSANVSLLFAEVSYPDRFAAAAAAGFDAVETWWPFPVPDPSPSEVEDLLDVIKQSGVRLTGLNFYAGDMSAGERGVACRPERHDQLRASLPTLLTIAERTGCRSFNLLYGQIDSATPAGDQHRAAAEAIGFCAEAIAPLGGTVLLEPLAEGLNGSYPLLTGRDVLDLLDGPLSGVTNAALLLDTFHLGMNGVDLSAAVREADLRIGHVQVADAPGRGEPGTGSLDWEAFLGGLGEIGYRGLLGCEYKPTGSTTDSLAWVAG